MKISKFILAVVALFFFVNTSFAQSTKTQAKAAEKVAKINKAITSIDESLALSTEQTEKLLALQIQVLIKCFTPITAKPGVNLVNEID